MTLPLLAFLNRTFTFFWNIAIPLHITAKMPSFGEAFPDPRNDALSR